MKKLLAMLMLATVIVASYSCKKDKDAQQPDAAKLIGIWNGLAQYDTEYEDGTIVNRDTTKIVSPDYMKINFKADSTFSVDLLLQGEQDQEVGPFSIRGNAIVLYPDTNDEESYSFAISDNTLRLTTSDENTNAGHTYKTVTEIVLER